MDNNTSTGSNEKGKRIPPFLTLWDGDIPVKIPFKEVAELMGVHPKTVWRWEKGIQSPDAVTMAYMRIMFLGEIPFYGWDQFRFVNSGIKSGRRRKPLHVIRRRGYGQSDKDLSPNNIDTWSERLYSKEWIIGLKEKQIFDLSEDNQVLESENTQMKSEILALKAEIERLRDIIVYRPQAPARGTQKALRLVKG